MDASRKVFSNMSSERGVIKIVRVRIGFRQPIPALYRSAMTTCRYG
jgi:hypothetical protein